MTVTSAAAERVAAWPVLSREPGAVYRLRSGGFLVETGADWPTWCDTETAAQQLVLNLGLPSGPVVDFEPATP